MRVLKTAIGEVLGLTFSPDGRALAAAVEKEGVFLWNLDSTGPPIKLDGTSTFRTSAYRAKTLYFTPDSRSVGWLGWTGWKVYDRDTQRVTQLRLDAGGNLTWLALTPDGSRLVSEYSFPDLSLVGWKSTDEGSWEQEWSISTVDMAVHSTTVCPTGRRVAILTRSPVRKKGQDYTFRLELRSAVSGAVEASAPYPYEEHYPLVFSPDGSQLIAVHEMTLLVWSVPHLGEPRLIRNDSRKHFTAAAYHPSGRYLFAASNDATVHVFDTSGWARQARYNWKMGRLRAVAISPDGALAAAAADGDRGEIVVWDVDL